MYECTNSYMFFVFIGGKFMNISYKIFNPAGNITALVVGDEYDLEQKIKNKKSYL